MTRYLNRTQIIQLRNYCTLNWRHQTRYHCCLRWKDFCTFHKFGYHTMYYPVFNSIPLLRVPCVHFYCLCTILASDRINCRFSARLEKIKALEAFIVSPNGVWVYEFFILKRRKLQAFISVRETRAWSKRFTLRNTNHFFSSFLFYLNNNFSLKNSCKI